MIIRLLAFLVLLLFTSNTMYAKESVGVIKNDEDSDKPQKHNIVEILESFGVNPVVIDYKSIIDWREIKRLKVNEADKKIHKALKKLLEDNKITKIVIGDDSHSFTKGFDSNSEERRSRVTKAIVDLQKRNKVSVLAIAGGMDGILYHNGVNIEEIKVLINPKKIAKYGSATIGIKAGGKQSCTAPMNKVLVLKSSEMGRLMQLAEEKYKIKYEVSGENYVTEIQFSHLDTISPEEENLDQLDNAGFKITGRSLDGIIFIVENKTNNDVLIAGHPMLANVIRCPDTGSKESRIFARLLFCNLLNSRGQPKLPKDLLKPLKW